VFPESRAALVVVEDRRLPVAELAALLSAVGGFGARFPAISLDASTR
jgi:hypothetical protein